MKRTIAIVLCAFLLIVSNVMAEEATGDTGTQRLEISQARVTYKALALEVSMATTISYIQELGGDTSEIESVQAEFSALADQIATFTTKEELRANNVLMRENVREFKELSRTLVLNNGGDMETLKTRVKDAIAADSEVQAAKDAFQGLTKSFLLEKFDKHYSKLETTYNKMAERYGDTNPDEVTNLQSILDSFAASRTTLESVAGAGESESVKEVTDALKDLNEQFKTAVQGLTGADEFKERKGNKPSQEGA